MLEVDFIREVFYPDWLVNVVMVKKSNGKWRMCIDFTDMNKACPKDSFPLPRIDQLVDSTKFLLTNTTKRRPRLSLAKGYTVTRLCPLD